MSPFIPYLTGEKKKPLLLDMAENGHVESLKQFLTPLYDLERIQIMPDDAVISFGDALAELLEFETKEERLNYIDQTLDYLSIRNKKYLKELQNSRKEISRLSYEQKNGLRPVYNSKELREKEGYSDTCQQEVIRSYTITHRYHSLEHGYDHRIWKMENLLAEELTHIKEYLLKES